MRNCKCYHHWGLKLMAALIWLSGVLFFWSGLKGALVWGYDPLFYAWSVVVLSLLAYACGYCGCCGSGEGKSENTCSHEGDCKCGDCDKCC